MVEIPQDALRLLYAKLNAHEVVLRVALRALADLSPGNLENLRMASLDQADILQRREGEPNPDFADQGRLETVAFAAQTLACVSAMEAVLGDQTSD